MWGLSRWSRLPLGLLGLIAVSAAAGIVSVVVRNGSAGLDAYRAGDLAPLLAAQRADQIEATVAVADRLGLSTARLQTAWARAIETAGSFQAVTHTLTVHAGQDRIELEQLRFEQGTGTLTARRSPQGITAMWLTTGTVSDPAAARSAAAYSLDLVSDRLGQVSAVFDTAMNAALPVSRFQSDTATALAGLQTPADVAAQVVSRVAGTTVVSSYLVFSNGLRRVVIAFDNDQRVAGLFIFPI